MRKKFLKYRIIFFSIAIILLAFIIFLGFKSLHTDKLSLAEDRFRSLVPIIDNLVKEAISYGKENRMFPNAYQLGLSSTPDNYYVDDPTAISKYLGGKPVATGKSLNMSDVSESNPCRAEGKLWSDIDVELLGFPSDFASNAGNNGFECHYWYYQDDFHYQCFYGLGTAENSQTGDIIPGWVNANTTRYWDFKGMDNYSEDGHNNASCPP